VREGRGWLAQATHASTEVGREDAGVQLARARALNAAGVLAREAGDFAGARPLLTESVALFKTLGENERLANAEQNLGQVLFRQGDRDAARAHLETSLERLRRLGDKAQALSVGEPRRELGPLASHRPNATLAKHERSFVERIFR
jgi:tetratricopeptide (TPR) repeat protein